jgi:hypothetical protein
LERYPEGKSGSAYHVPGDVLMINQYAFFQVRNLSEVYLNDGLYWIQYFAFSRMDQLSKVYIPASVVIIEYATFSWNPALVIFCQGEGEQEGWQEGWNLQDQEVIFNYSPEE